MRRRMRRNAAGTAFPTRSSNDRDGGQRNPIAATQVLARDGWASPVVNPGLPG